MSGTPAKKAAPSLKEMLNKPKDEDSSEVTAPEEITSEENKETYPNEDYLHMDEGDKADKPALSRQVVSTVPDKTPAELSSETQEETARRYGVDQTITDEDADNPRVQVYRDTKVNQVPSGTHLHPDIAKDLLNRGISEQHTDNAQVKRTIVETYDFAPDAPNNDKF
jgi:hypothetical protein